MDSFGSRSLRVIVKPPARFFMCQKAGFCTLWLAKTDFICVCQKKAVPLRRKGISV